MNLEMGQEVCYLPCAIKRAAFERGRASSAQVDQRMSSFKNIAAARGESGTDYDYQMIIEGPKKDTVTSSAVSQFSSLNLKFQSNHVFHLDCLR